MNSAPTDDATVSQRLWRNERELIARRWHQIFVLGVAVLLPAWIAFDFVFVPSYWVQFAVVRVGVSLLLLSALLLSHRFNLPSLFLGYVGSILMHFTICLLLPFTGNALWMYSLGFTAAFIGASMLLFWPVKHTIFIIALTFAFYIFCFYQFSNLKYAAVLGHGGAVTFTVAIASIFLSWARNAMAAREFKTRLQLYRAREEVERKARRLGGALDELENKSQLLEMELDIAVEIQQSVLPEGDYHFENIRVLSYNQPLGKVGGDFFDFTPLSDTRLAVMIIDASGHGVPAALITMAAKIGFSNATRAQGSAREILNHMNDSMSRAITTQEYLTAMCLVIEARGSRIEIANAGHRPAVILRRRAVSLDVWNPDGMIMGVESSNFLSSLEESGEVYESGDRIFLYTDGFIDALNAEGETFGFERFCDLIFESREMELTEQREFVLNQWRAFIAEPLVDDAALLIISL